MRGKWAAVLAWGAMGHAAAAALFWTLLNVPDSNAWMLGVSALLVAVLLAVGAVVEVTAADWLVPGVSFRTALARGHRGVPAFLVALAVFAVFWWSAGLLDTWHAAHRGEVDAWLMSRWGNDETAWAHRAIGALVFVAWAIVGVSLAVSVVFAFVRGGLAAVARFRWLPAGLSRRALGLTAAAVVLLIALPAKGVYWRPQSLPADRWELAFVGAKLLTLYLLAHVGWLFVLAAGSIASEPPGAESPRGSR